MEVTEVRVFLAEEEDERLKAYATVTFDNCFVVRDLKIISGNTGLFVAMPSKKRKDGTYKDVAHPIHSDFRQALEQTILAKYNDEIKGIGAGMTTTSSERGIERVHTGSDETTSGVIGYGAGREFDDGVSPLGLKKA